MHPVVEKIRKAMEQRDGLSEAVMSPLAAAYGQAVETVNERLGEAAALLDRNLRSEAIQRASVTPNAIQGAADLDFPEAEEWMEILQFLDVTLPPQVDLEAAQRLNEAIVETQPLDKLLCRHRLLALARAPLARRMKVLRRIAELDPMNEVWAEDLENWERDRTKQIAREFAQAIADDDEQRILSLNSELTSTPWHVTPGESLLKRARDAAKEFMRRRTHQSLAEVAEQMHEAFSRFEEAGARQQRTHWKKLAGQLDEPPPPDLAEQAAPALAWLEELDQQQQLERDRASALQRLQAAIDQDESADALHRAYREASRFDEPVPPELEQGYRVLIADHQLLQRRKLQLTVIGIAAAVLIVAFAISVFAYRSSQREQLASAVSELQELLASGQLIEAEQFLSELGTDSPAMVDAPELVSLTSRVQQQRTQEDERRRQFEEFLSLADHEDASEIDVPALDRAVDLAKTETERSAALQIRRRLQQWRQKVAEQETTATLEKVQAVTATLDEIEAAQPSPEIIRQVASILQELQQLPKQFPNQSSQSEAQIELVRSRASSMQGALRQAVDDTSMRQSLYDKLIRSGNVSDYREHLESYAEQAVDLKLAEALGRSLEEKQLWDLPQQVNSFLQKLEVAIAGGMTPEQAVGVRKELSVIQVHLTKHPAADHWNELQLYLKAAEKRPQVLEETFAALNESPISELMTVLEREDEAGIRNRRFIYASYYENSPQLFKVDDDGNGSSMVGVEVVVNPSAAVSRASLEAPFDVYSEPNATIHWLLDQRQRNEQAFLRDWSGTFLKLVADLRQREELDGLVKEMLLRHLLQAAALAAPSLQEELKPALELLEERQEFQNHWFQPRPLQTSLEPELDERLVPILSGVYRQRNDDWQQLSKASVPRYRWVGFVFGMPENSNNLIFCGDRPRGEGAFYVIRPDLSSEGQSRMVVIGRYINNQATLSTEGRRLSPGLPVFFYPDQPGEDDTDA